jgi:hypothetical protein
LSTTDPIKKKAHSPFLPVLLALVSLFLSSGFQTIRLFEEGSDLRSLRASQENVFENAQKMRAQLDAIASGTAGLAAAGNPRAKLVVDALRDRGITIKPNAPGSPSGG